jgi:hypothetical protein
MALSIVIEGEDLTVGLGNAAQGCAVTVVFVGIFVDVVSKVDNIVDRVLCPVSTSFQAQTSA